MNTHPNMNTHSLSRVAVLISAPLPPITIPGKFLDGPKETIVSRQYKATQKGNV